jgi:hypothetical protein
MYANGRDPVECLKILPPFFLFPPKRIDILTEDMDHSEYSTCRQKKTPKMSIICVYVYGDVVI